MKHIRTFLILLLIVALTATGCAKSTDSFQEYVKNGDYAKAIELFGEKIMGNSEDELACRLFLSEYANEKLSAFAEGTCTQAEFDAALDTVSKVDDYLYLMDDLGDIYWQYEELVFSKDQYEMAVQYEAEGLLEDAIWAFSSVSPADLEHFEHAQANIDRLMLQITQRFEDAIHAASDAGNVPELFLVYLEGMDNPYVNISSEISLLYETTMATYLTNVQQQAEEAFGGDAKDYNAALEVVRNAISEVNFMPQLLTSLEAMLEEYLTYVPFPLTQLEYVQKAEYIAVGNAREKDATDISGIYHDEDNVIASKGGSLNSEHAEAEDEAYVLYNLNYEYSTLTGVIYRPYSFLSFPNEETKPVTVKIYGDGVLLFEMNGFNGNHDSVPFELDVSAVRNLKIVMMGVWRESSGWIGIYDYHPKVCMGDLILQK